REASAEYTASSPNSRSCGNSTLIRHSYDLLQQDCLEISLESNLKEIASPKELRMLDVSNMDHHITDAENGCSPIDPKSRD
ncbi:hypothetical protein BGZ93_003727, partial [Podila epicladia]